MDIQLQIERDAFNAFIDSRLGQASSELGLEDALSEFRAYQRELADAQAKVQQAKTSSSRGESAELDVEQLVQEVTDELNAEGIRE